MIVGLWLRLSHDHQKKQLMIGPISHPWRTNTQTYIITD